jgi:hypothetical protein
MFQFGFKIAEVKVRGSHSTDVFHALESLLRNPISKVVKVVLFDQPVRPRHESHHLGRERGYAIQLSIRKTIFDSKGLAFRVA